MKTWKCPNCANVSETEDDVKFNPCKRCLTDMKEFPRESRDFLNEVGENGRNS